MIERATLVEIDEIHFFKAIVRKNIGLMSVFEMFHVLSMEHKISGSCVTFFLGQK